MPEQDSQLPSGRFVFTDGIVSIGGTEFRWHNVKCGYVSNQIPVSEITLMSDNATEDASYPQTMQEAYKALLKTAKGDDVLVTTKITTDADDTAGTPALSNKKVTLFTGVLLGWAPVWFAPRSLKLTVWAIHPLGLLDWASMFVNPVQGSGFDDYGVPPVITEKDEIVPYMMGEYKDTDVTTDLWGKVIKPELIKLCRAKKFDDKVNAEKTAKYLESKSDQSAKLTWQLENPQKVILDVRRTLYSAVEGRKSLWDALVTLSDIYKFSIVARANDFSIAPIIPTLGGDPPKNSMMTWQRYSRRQEFNSLARQITQSVGMLRGTGGMPGYFDTKSKKSAQSLLTLSADKVIAGTDYVPYPAFMDFRYDPFFKTGNTVGLKDETLFAAGYRLKEDATEVPTLNTAYNKLSADDLKKYASVIMSERAFDGFSGVFYGNTTFNECPGNTVIVEPPLALTFSKSGDVVSTKATTYYFGHVWAVTIVFDAAGKTSGTYTVLTHIRTTPEQEALELKTHPLYNKRWVSTPVLTIPGYTAKPEVEA